MLGERRAVLIDYDEWAGDPATVIAAFRELDLPRDDAAVRAAVGRRLAHGPHAEPPGPTA
jgi:hypothetical protein